MTNPLAFHAIEMSLETGKPTNIDVIYYAENFHEAITQAANERSGKIGPSGRTVNYDGKCLIFDRV